MGKKNSLKFNRGFTLVELVVAFGLFVILMSIASGGFVIVLKNQRAATALMSVSDSVSISLEQMSREIRTGFAFSKNSDTEIQFVNSYNQVIWYRLNENAIERGTENVAMQRTYKKITADDVDIKDFKIALSGADVLDDYPPRITLSLIANSNEPSVKKMDIAPVIVQTTISSRTAEQE